MFECMGVCRRACGRVNILIYIYILSCVDWRGLIDICAREEDCEERKKEKNKRTEGKEEKETKRTPVNSME